MTLEPRAERENYAYWRTHGGSWADLYDDRKRFDTHYHIQELMLASYIAAHAAKAERPLRVLEVGCGVGRHLRNLRDIPRVEIHGFDQSAAMLEGCRRFAPDDWMRDRIRCGPPTGRLPYDDGAFDIVYTAEVLVHVRPEDVGGVIDEIRRVCRGHVLHLEPTPGFPISAAAHGGCWAHNLSVLYSARGLPCESLPRGYEAHSPWRVTVGEKSNWCWDPVVLNLYRRLEQDIESGHHCFNVWLDRVYVPRGKDAEIHPTVSNIPPARLLQWKRRAAPHGGNWRIAAVSPCFQRPGDIDTLAGDLDAADLTGIDLTWIVVDNASEPPLTVPERTGFSVRVVRNSENTGGAGGFNTGMRTALAMDPPPDFVWLIDSDARPTSEALRVLVDVLSAYEGLAAAGSELRDTASGFTYEVGGMVNRRVGNLVPALVGHTPVTHLRPCDYLAACSLLVRADAVRTTGLMPEVFIFGDDVEWTIALSHRTGKGLAAVPGSVVYHPWRKFAKGFRYFSTRNGFAPLARLGLPRTVRFRKGLLETGFLTALSTMGLHELAEACVQGLKDAASGHTTGKGWLADRPLPSGPTLRPLTELAAAIAQAKDRAGPHARVFVHPSLGEPWPIYADVREQLSKAYLDPRHHATWHGGPAAALIAVTLWHAVRRLVLGAKADVCVVPIGWCTNWIHGTNAIVVAGDSFFEVPIRPWRTLPRSMWNALRGLWYSARIACGPPRVNELPRV